MILLTDEHERRTKEFVATEILYIGDVGNDKLSRVGLRAMKMFNR